MLSRFIQVEEDEDDEANTEEEAVVSLASNEGSESPPRHAYTEPYPALNTRYLHDVVRRRRQRFDSGSVGRHRGVK